MVKEIHPLYGQVRVTRVERLSTVNGLSTNQVNEIIQDRDGFYWIATLNGLNRFDGSTFHVFQHSKNDSTSIANNFCNKVLEGNDGDIWVATLRGVCRYQKRKGVFKNYFLQNASINNNISNSVFGLSKDGNGNIWATSHGLWKINTLTDSISCYVYDKEDPGSMSEPSNLFNICYDSVNHGFWMNTDHALNFFDIKRHTFFHHRNNPLNWPVFQLGDKRPFFAKTNSFFWAYDRTDNRLYQYDIFNKFLSSNPISFKQAISNFSADDEANPVFSFELVPSIIYHWRLQKEQTFTHSVTSSGAVFSGIFNRIYKDRDNNKWLSSGEGLFIIKHDANLLKTYSLGGSPSGTPHIIYSFAKQKNNLWLETRNGFYKYDLENQKIYPINGNEQKSNRVLLNAGDSLLWLGGISKIFLMDFRNSKIVSEISLEGNPYFAITDKQKHVWVGTWNNGLYELDERARVITHYNNKNGLPANYLICGWYDGNRELWLGMNGGNGFTKLDLVERKFESFLITSERKPAIEFNSINAIINDKQGNLWLGTHGGGIYYFNRKQHHFQNYQQSDGLSSNNINNFRFDSSGNLWISTFNGIDILDTSTKNIRHVNEPIQQVNTDHIENSIVGDDGAFFYSANNKVLTVNPGKYITVSPEATILISELKIFDKEEPSLLSNLPIQFSYNQNFFSIGFSVLKVSPDIPAQYKYRLDGFNNDWVYSNNKGLANFTNVPPGYYTLLLNATNESGKWNNKELAIPIIISPPFWKTWWFYIVCTLVLGSLVLFAIKNRIGQFKKRQQEQLRLVVATQEREKKSIASELHDDLGVRLSALKYFISALKKHLRPNDGAGIETYNKTISIIDESVEDVRYLLINLSPKTLNDYGYLVAVEDLVNKLSKLHVINISLVQDGIDQRMPAEVEAGLYRITQELINNTLKHADASLVTLSIKKIDDMIILKYTDDGKGFDHSLNGKGYGMENIHTRVALLNGKIEWETGKGKQTKVLITIPYNHT
ncbi:MAG: two-component regulator propeller domain-containing protein [Chitinophagaceae bacterium]